MTDYIDFTPSEDYDTLKKQTVALVALLNTKHKEIELWRKQASECDGSVLKEYKERLESEMAMNDQLTRELEHYE
jgi:hypothetical protein